MEFKFKELFFQVTSEGRVALTQHHLTPEALDAQGLDAFLGIELAGGLTTGTNEQAFPQASYDLRYVGHEIKGDTLTLLQRSSKLEVLSTFVGYNNTNAIRLWHTIKNISEQEVCLEWANTLTLEFSQHPVEEKRDWLLHKFTNTRYAEVQPVVKSFLKWASPAVIASSANIT